MVPVDMVKVMFPVPSTSPVVLGRMRGTPVGAAQQATLAMALMVSRRLMVVVVITEVALACSGEQAQGRAEVQTSPEHHRQEEMALHLVVVEEIAMEDRVAAVAAVDLPI